MKKIFYLILSLGVFWTGGVFGETVPFTVSANVVGSCEITVSPGDISFSDYDGTSKSAYTTFAVNCTTGLDYGVYITPVDRLLSGPGGSLEYLLYHSGSSYPYPADPNCGEISVFWPTSAPGTTAVGNGTNQYWGLCGVIGGISPLPGVGLYQQDVTVHVEIT